MGLHARVGEAIGLDIVADVLPSSTGAAGNEGPQFIQGDVYDLPFPPASFDVVHAHQVLQHLSSPVQALSEMRRVLKPGGFIAARDAVYSTMRGAPAIRALDKWRSVYMATCRRNGHEPDAGLYLQQWMLEAGFSLPELTYTTSSVTYSGVDDDFRRKWGEAWQERAVKSDFPKHAKRHGLADQAELDAISKGWQRWTEDPSSTWMYLNGEIVGEKPS